MRFGRWTAGLVVLAWLGATVPALAGVMSQAEFRLEIRDAIVRLDPRAKIKLIGEDTLKVESREAKTKAGAESSVFVGNAYERYQNSPDQLEEIVGQMARAALIAQTAPAIAPESLVVLLRPADYVERFRSQKIGPLIRPFAGDFIEIIAIDTGETFRTEGADMVTPLFPDEAAAWARARANTLAKMGRLKIESLEPGVWTITNDTSLALEFVNQPDTWAAHGVTMTGDPVAVFSQRNLLLLADGGDKERLERLAMFVKQVAGDPEIMSTTIFTRHNGVWSVLEQRP